MTLENAIQNLDVFIEKNTMYMSRHEEMVEAWHEVKRNVNVRNWPSGIEAVVKAGDLRETCGMFYVVTIVENKELSYVIHDDGSAGELNTRKIAEDKIISRHQNFYDAIAHMQKLKEGE